MNDHQADLARLRAELASYNLSDLAEVQRWFADHPYLSTNDHAQVMNRSLMVVRAIKRQANIRGHSPKVLPISKRQRKINTIVVPPNWRTPEWLGPALQQHSISSLSKATGMSRKSLWFLAKKLDLPTPPRNTFTKSTNPCCTREWVHEHYVEQQLTQQQCADLAGICVQNFANWLNRFQIPIRRQLETCRGKREAIIWHRKFEHQLRRQEIVRKLMLRKDQIHVRFRNYYWETYYFGDDAGKHPKIPRSYIINEAAAKLEHVPSIQLEYENDLHNPYGFPAHIIISPREWRKASFMERRIAIHQFAWHVNRRSWIHPAYPQHIIQADWERLLSVPQAKYLRKNKFTAFPRYGTKPMCGIPLVIHFFGLQEMAKDFTSPKLMIEALNIASTKRSKINLTHIIRIFNNLPRTRVARLFDPGVYRWVLHQLGVTGTVLDLYPNFGHRAMACAMLGLKYTAVVTPRFQAALDRGFADFIGLDFEPYTGQAVDCVLSDDDFGVTPIGPALQVARNTKRIIHFVRQLHRNAFAKKFPMAKSIPVTTKYVPSPPDYLFIL